jgi:hypothetical protein
MGILRNKLANNFVQIPSEIFSSELSHIAVRVYGYLATKPDGWKVYNADIMRQCKIGSNNTMAKLLKELVDSGWVDRERSVDSKKSFDGGFDYELMSKPANSQKELNRSNCDNAESAKHSNTNLPTNTKTESNTNGFIKFWSKYPNKKNKAQAVKAFNKLSSDDQQLAIDGVNGYLGAVTQDKFICHASTYLNNARWEDQENTEAVDDYSWADGNRVSDHTNLIEGEVLNGR